MKNALKKYLKDGGEIGSLAKMPKGRKASAPFPCKPMDVLCRQSDVLAQRLERIGVSKVVIGISGGLDSALCLIAAVGAFEKLGLDKSGILLYTMPGFGTSARTKSNAVVLCNALGLNIETINISAACKEHFKFIGHDGKTKDVTYENVQARMRTMILMNKANMYGAIVLGTGDMSEIALGWSTYNGDHMSMFGVNAGVPKTIVRKVCRAWAEERLLQNAKDRAAKSMLDIVNTPVSPELVKGQITEDKIGPYELHDFFIWNFVMNGLGRARLAKAAEKYFKGAYSNETIGRTLDIFLSRLVSQAFKRNCAPDGIKVFPFEFSLKDWWIPSDLPKGLL
jgi:NAD+ synthase (glutamine-hydrolysing)